VNVGYRLKNRPRGLTRDSDGGSAALCGAARSHDPKDTTKMLEALPAGICRETRKTALT
jgi:hypothetical protein